MENNYKNIAETLKKLNHTQFSYKLELSIFKVNKTLIFFQLL